ncbi:hypothetical protein TDB9533_02296 [Thalassocella blandensis]|nr:hypothetical protein TDB9533_02296 [Thalassocella blandensis]
MRSYGKQGLGIRVFTKAFACQTAQKFQFLCCFLMGLTIAVRVNGSFS